MTNKNIFREVAEQIFNNEKYNNERVIKFKNFYPQNAVVHMTTVMKAFKVTGIKKSYNYNTGKFNYKLSYDDLHKYSDLTNIMFEIDEEQHYKKALKGYFDDKNKVNDLYRVEFECPNWSSQRDEYGYAPCPFNDKGYEQLDPEDNVILNFRLQELGYKDYTDFVQQHKELTKSELQEVMSEELSNVLVAQEWEV